MLLEIFRGEGHDAKGFASAQEAVTGILDFDPDVVVSDVAMPVMNGWDLARHVRKVKGAERPMMIAVSGVYTKGADKVLANLSGFNYHFVKPCDPNLLLALMEKVRPGHPG